MVNRWEAFNQRKEKEFSSLRELLIITLFGSYYPKKEEKFLLKLKEFLVGHGYKLTKIVKDYESEYLGLNSSELSHRCLEFSDVNFFIITKRGNNKGVIRELAFLADDVNLVHKQDYTVIFEEESKFSPLSKLTLDDIDSLSITRREYSGIRKLEKQILNESFFYLRKLRFKLEMNRP